MWLLVTVHGRPTQLCHLQWSNLTAGSGLYLATQCCTVCVLQKGQGAPIWTKRLLQPVTPANQREQPPQVSVSALQCAFSFMFAAEALCTAVALLPFLQQQCSACCPLSPSLLFELPEVKCNWGDACLDLLITELNKNHCLVQLGVLLLLQLHLAE